MVTFAGEIVIISKMRQGPFLLRQCYNKKGPFWLACSLYSSFDLSMSSSVPFFAKRFLDVTLENCSASGRARGTFLLEGYSLCGLLVLVTLSSAALFRRHRIALLWFGPIERTRNVLLDLILRRSERCEKQIVLNGYKFSQTCAYKNICSRLRSNKSLTLLHRIAIVSFTPPPSWGYTSSNARIRVSRSGSYASHCGGCGGSIMPSSRISGSCSKPITPTINRGSTLSSRRIASSTWSVP